MKDNEVTGHWQRLHTKNVSPITQLGLPELGGILTPASRSKMAPSHRVSSLRALSGAKLKSTGLISHEVPPKLNDTVTLVLQAE